MTSLYFFSFKHLKYKLSSLFNAEIFIFAVCREDSYQSIVSCAAVVLTPVEPTVDTRKKEQTILPDVSKQWVIQTTWSFISAIETPGQILSCGCAYTPPFCFISGYIGISKSRNWPEARLLLLFISLTFFPRLLRMRYIEGKGIYSLRNWLFNRLNKAILLF